ncbi:DUF6204 family protein [Streptomyces sp. AC627_RSS907]|uniref:DUF6204 family protein n=1 Tax=Streptomyces sp. AC627_RSS907 TaxID=2823684 RepID=UPI001C246FD9|nr:DUF6204 family protein [Streptomyces sp. AC627_RSS907]
MPRKNYQVIVYGKFAPLDDDQRARLLAVADEHDLFHSKFTEEGTVTYERSLLTFTFRCVMKADAEDKTEAVVADAEKMATGAVRDLGADVRDLRSVCTDLETIKIKRRGR